jgi:octaprenyl-diphosphate synthase
MLDKVDKCITKYIEDLNEDIVLKLYAKISSGKKLRAKLILKIATSKSEKAIILASVVEMIHAASLLHDDVIDEADTRRGEASINALFGDKTAIMLGDILYSKAFFELCDFSDGIAKTISNAVTLLSVGELLDVELSKSFNADKDKYFDMIYKKTASLIEAASSSAAMLAGLDGKKFALYGKNLGLAFQIIDDVLDITSDEKILGKPAMNDFKEGKTTLPYIFLYEKLNDEEKKKLLTLFKRDIDKDEQEWIKEKLKESGALRKTLDIVNDLANEALEAIKEYKNEELEKIIKDMIQREY